LRLRDGNSMAPLADPQAMDDSEVVLCNGHATRETSITSRGWARLTIWSSRST